MSQTSEFAIISEYNKESEKRKNDFMISLANLKSLQGVANSTIEESLDQSHRMALKYFQHAEQFARDSIHLDASKNPEWQQEIAEDSHDILKSIIGYHRMLQRMCQKHGFEYKSYVPSISAYSSMQRLVCAHFEQSIIDDLIKTFGELQLPVTGLQAPPNPSSPVEPQPNRRRELRNQIDALFQDYTELESFLVDYFPLVKKEITSNMPRTAVISLLLENAKLEEIILALQQQQSSKPA